MVSGQDATAVASMSLAIATRTAYMFGTTVQLPGPRQGTGWPPNPAVHRTWAAAAVRVSVTERPVPVTLFDYEAVG